MRNLRIPILQRSIWMMLCLSLSCSGNRWNVATTKPSHAEKHPVLLFTAEDISTIRSRIDREPYASWWKWIQHLADDALTVDCESISLERKRSEFAKALAFAFIVTGDSVYAKKAAAMLETVRPVEEGGNWGDIHTEIDAVPNYCQAYDMMAPYLSSLPDSNRKIRNTLYKKGHRLYTYSSLKETANNWRIRRCAALGMCALVIAEYGTGEHGSNPGDWHVSALKGLTKTIDYQTTSDGGHAEGPNYLRYSADIYIPYLIALCKATGTNLFKTEIFQELHNWGVKIRLPNGQRPNVDDAALDGFYGGLFAGLSPDPQVNQWDWLTAEESHFCPDLKRVEAICYFDDTLEAQSPPWNPTIFLQEAGNAVFRSDWSQDAVYMLLLGEHDKVQVHGGAHEHPDPMSFIIHAFGEMLAIDSGYIKWSEREKVNTPQNHNLILVDGKGPSSPNWLLGWHGGTDAYLQNYFTTDFVDYGEVKTQYQGVEFLRSVFFPQHRYFIITDDIRSDRDHRYSWLLHGNGHSKDGTFVLTDTGGLWTVNDISLHAFLTAPADMTLSEQQNIHSFNYGKELSHSLLKAEIHAEDTRFLSILFPCKKTDVVPSVTPFAYQNIHGVNIEHESNTDLIMVCHGDESIFLADSIAACGSIQTDAIISFASCQKGDLHAMAVISGTQFQHTGRMVFRSEESITIALRREANGMDGYVKGNGQYHLELFTDFPPDAVSFRNTPIDFQFDDGNVIVSVEGEGSLNIRWSM